ncbi:MAG: phenylalanine--tRNA ligase subunit beta, partial [Pseudobdellovibrionaceae bacterium]
DVQNLAQHFKNVKVGLVVELQQHPNADKLTLCRVSTGEDVHQIVCGAKNHRAGDRVVVALPGAVLPGNFAIKKSMIRNIESAGMLCSAKELGLAGESEGIVILPADAPVGQDFAVYGELEDTVFELKVTPNRADCLSHFGLAREVSCLFKRPLKSLAPELKKLGPATADEIEVLVKDASLCPRYAGRVIRGVKVGDSPTWLKKSLEKVGHASINNIVDVTNYVMLELGQPLHAFDLGKISEKQIIIDKSKAQEKFITLAATEVTLSGAELTIRDAKGPLCIAGVIGGQSSGVSVDTKDIFLESAYFTAQSVRKTARHLGIDTDSSYRFSRGVDKAATLLALNRATELILQVAGGLASDKPYDVFLQDTTVHSVPVQLSHVSQKLGYAVNESSFVEWMTALGCQVQGEKGLYKITVPSFRSDIEAEVDIIEEYARLNGYEHIPETLPINSVAPTAHDKNYLFNKRIQDILKQQGFFQASNLLFVSQKKEEAFLADVEVLKSAGLKTENKSVALLNPLSEDLNGLRRSLSFGLVQNLVQNFNYENHAGRLFELGSVVLPDYSESSRLALVQWGRSEDLWNKDKTPLVFHVKGVIENLLKFLGISAFKWEVLKVAPAFLHPGQSAVLVVEGQKVGFLGHLHPQLLQDNKVRESAVLCELQLDGLLKGQPRPIKVKSISKFPIVERDFSFVVKEDIAAADILADVKKTAGALLKELKVFDIYQGDKINAGYKSLSLRLKLQGTDQTLQESQINELQQKVLQALQKNFAATVR